MKGQEKKESPKKEKLENKTKVLSDYQKEKQSKSDKEFGVKSKT